MLWNWHIGKVPLKGCELYLFMDNFFVAELCYYNRGSNVNKDLGNLVLLVLASLVLTKIASLV